MLQHSTIQLLRFHFSFFLLPVFLFALCISPSINITDTLLVFFILHFLVYPSSNGYNSYMDKDETPIGGLQNPLLPTKQLFYVTIAMDALAIILSFFISSIFAASVLLYILASRAYSYRGIRLKKYPVLGYLTVVIFQGMLVFFNSYYAANKSHISQLPVVPAITAGLLIGGSYPLTQVYQHAEDKKDGVQTISMMLGIKGTFIFCGIIFLSATVAMFFSFYQIQQVKNFFVFTAAMLPMVIFFSYWFAKILKDEKNANFKNSLYMNILASSCTTISFTVILILQQF